MYSLILFSPRCDIKWLNYELSINTFYVALDFLIYPRDKFHRLSKCQVLPYGNT